MLNVYITVDTEVSPLSRDYRGLEFRADMDRDIFGLTPRGEFGLRYLLAQLNSHDLRGVFLVDSMLAPSAGIDTLGEIVRTVQDAGQDVQHHLHTEWLGRIEKNTILPGRTGKSMRCFTLEEQTKLLELGRASLQQAGAKNVCAFRAGGYGADFNTLRALAASGHTCDTSYNFCWQGRTCDMPLDGPLLGPRNLHGVWEFPVSMFSDWPGHYRHAQVGACSSGEMLAALEHAQQEGWEAFVIVMHSFELIKRSRRLGEPSQSDRIAISRFERLCRFLADNRGRFRTADFAALDTAALRPQQATTVRAPSPLRTAWRCSQQLARRWV